MVEQLSEAYAYFLTHTDEFAEAFGEHMLLVAISLGISIIICVPLGVWISRSKTAATAVINTFNTLRVIPSLAVLFLAIPYFGLSLTSALLALTLLALPPILINTEAAYRTIPEPIKEAARGMGMTPRQILWRIETPLALPVIIAGVRTATTEVIASATLAAFIGVGGFGLFVVRGFALYSIPILLVGALPVAFLAILAEIALGGLQRWLSPPQ